MVIVHNDHLEAADDLFFVSVQIQCGIIIFTQNITLDVGAINNEVSITPEVELVRNKHFFSYFTSEENLILLE